MAQGALAGMAAGLLAGAAGLVVLGVLVPPEAAGPPPPRVTAPAPVPGAGPAAPAAAPAAAEGEGEEEDEAAAAEALPEAAPDEAAGVADAAPEPTGEAETEGAATEDATAEDATTEEASTEDATAGDAARPEAGAAPPVVPLAPGQPAPLALLPQGADAPTRPAAEEGAPLATRPAAPAAPPGAASPRAEGAPAPIAEGAPAPIAEGAPEPPAGTGTEAAAASTEAAEAGTEAGGAPRGDALRRNAAPFVAFDDRPLMAVVLIEAGAEGVAPARLADLPVPVTFALDPLRPDLEEIAESLARAGFEVALLAPGGEGGLAADATPEAVAATLGGWFARLPRAVALIDGPEALLQGSQPLAEAMLDVIWQSGHGLALREGPPDTTARKAVLAEVPVAAIFRPLDADREGAVQQARYLDRAALKAQEDGAVVMIGHSYPETIEALAGWALGARARSVTLAPLSAVLLAGEGG